jgi:hypothetical protein
MAKHRINLSHCIQFHDTSILAMKYGHMEHTTREPTEIELQPDMNKEEEQSLKECTQRKSDLLLIQLFHNFSFQGHPLHSSFECLMYLSSPIQWLFHRQVLPIFYPTYSLLHQVGPLLAHSLCHGDGDSKVLQNTGAPQQHCSITTQKTDLKLRVS